MVSALDYIQLIQTDSLPIKVLGSDDNYYFLKIRHPRPFAVKASVTKDPEDMPGHFMNRILFNEHTAHMVGHALGCPLPQFRLVNVSVEFLKLNAPAIAREAAPFAPAFVAGLCHGSVEVPDLTTRLLFERAHEGDNLARFGSLALLFGLIGLAGDYQFFYKRTDPPDVYSLDHGFAFGGFAGMWSFTTLEQSRPQPPVLDPTIATKCRFKRGDVRGSVAALRGLSKRQIAAAVASSPAEWNITHDDRVAVALYLWGRRNDLLAYLTPLT